MQRWRARLTVRAAERHGATLVVVSGGTRTGGRPEAEQIIDLARAAGLPDRPTLRVVAEPRARSTWENVARAHPLVADVERVVLVSDPLHAARARSYWRIQFPEDPRPVHVTDAAGFWDGWWSKLPGAVDFAAVSLRDRIVPGARAQRRPARTPNGRAG